MVKLKKPPRILLYTIGLLIGVSLPILYGVCKTSSIIVDEEFHLSQGKRFCAGNYSHDPKITTFPGLYILTKIVWQPTFGCNIYTMRLTNVLGNGLVLFLIYYIRRSRRRDPRPGKDILTAFNMSIFPPLFFFSFTYYTETWSLVFTLVMYLCYLQKLPITLAASGALAILMRQTNVIWLTFFTTVYMVEEYVFLIKDNTDEDGKEHSRKVVKFRDFRIMAIIFKDLPGIKDLPPEYCRTVLIQSIPIGFFTLFIFLNRGITIGDKTAHIPTFHPTQMLYFFLFYLVFSITHLYNYLRCVTYVVKKYKFRTFLAGLLMAIIVYFFTHEHPYLLADNRHYTFYIWSRFYRKYWYFRYTIIPMYLTGAIFLWYGLTINNDVNFALQFFFIQFLLLCFQKLIDVRYFMQSFIIARLHMKHYSTLATTFETSLYFAINSITFYIFFTKEIWWKEYDEAQRLIW